MWHNSAIQNTFAKVMKVTKHTRCEMPSSPDTLWVLHAGFAEVMKVTKPTGLWDAELTCYSLSVTCRICWSRELDEPQWIVRCWTHLILFECYMPDLPKSWIGWTSVDCEMPSSPDTLRMIFSLFASMSWRTVS